MGPDNLQFKKLLVDAYSADPRTIVQIQREVFSKLFFNVFILSIQPDGKILEERYYVSFFLAYILYTEVCNKHLWTYQICNL